MHTATQTQRWKGKAMSEKALLTMMRLMEAKLRELMSAEDYSAFSVEVAKKGFLAEMEDMEDGEFKDFVMENFDRIVG